MCLEFSAIFSRKTLAFSSQASIKMLQLSPIAPVGIAFYRGQHTQRSMVRPVPALWSLAVPTAGRPGHQARHPLGAALAGGPHTPRRAGGQAQLRPDDPVQPHEHLPLPGECQTRPPTRPAVAAQVASRAGPGEAPPRGLTHGRPPPRSAPSSTTSAGGSRTSGPGTATCASTRTRSATRCVRRHLQSRHTGRAFC
jgi:hypothetical protein